MMTREYCLFITWGLRRIAALGPSEAKVLHESCTEMTFGDCSGVYIREVRVMIGTIKNCNICWMSLVGRSNKTKSTFSLSAV